MSKKKRPPAGARRPNPPPNPPTSAESTADVDGVLPADRRPVSGSIRESGNPTDEQSVPSASGPLLFTEEVRSRYFGGNVTAWWVRRNVAPTRKLRLGHSTVAWFEGDVVAWIAGRMGK
jgi:hypothetical protein